MSGPGTGAAIALIAALLFIGEASAAAPGPPGYGFRLQAPGVAVVGPQGAAAGGEEVLATVALPGAVHLLQIGELLYVARGPAGVTILDVSDPLHPREGLTFAQGPAVTHLTRSGDKLLLSRAGADVAIYDVSSPGAPTPIAPLSPWGAPPGGPRAPGAAPLRPLPDEGAAARQGRVLLITGGSILGGVYLVGAVVTALFDACSVGRCNRNWPMYIPIGGPFGNIGRTTFSTFGVIGGVGQLGGLSVLIAGAVVSGKARARRAPVTLLPYGTADEAGLVAVGRF